LQTCGRDMEQIMSRFKQCEIKVKGWTMSVWRSGFFVWNCVKCGENLSACLSTQHNITWGSNNLFKYYFYYGYRIRTYLQLFSSIST
jgi:hypothetical protein